MTKTQENRAIAIETLLGKDVLLLQSMSGTENLGQMFQFQLELLSEDYGIKFADIVGQKVTIRLNLSNGAIRYFNGHISRFIQTEGQGSLAHYQATVVPWMWFLTRTADCRIFQGKTVPQIIKEVFSEHGFSDIIDSLTGDYRKWDYCAQYRETDFNFISRLMEQEGIYYFFKHDHEKHSIVLADSIGAHESYPGYDQIQHRPKTGIISSNEYIWDWIVEMNIQPGMYAVRDFNFENVSADLHAVGKDTESSSLTAADRTMEDFEIFDYPGEYPDFKYGEKYARARIEELQAQKVVCQARSDARGIAAGHLFNLTDFPRSDQNGKYLFTSAYYRMTTDPYETDSQQTHSEPVFYCEFTAISSDQPYRTQRITQLPMIRGPQTAIVVGPSEEEIFTDKYGRVKVQFHWDRYGKFDENSSAWVRVSQNWAGKQYGAIHIPRIGEEVIVEFLEGDPDHPIITGRVYNADCMPPLVLPDNKTMSTLKSNSSKGGQGFNEIRFEDKKEEEQIFIHAEKNFDLRVKNDRFETIGAEGEGNRHLVVEKDKKEHVKNNRSEKVGADHMEEIGKDRHLKVKGKEAKGVDGSKSLMVKGDVIEVFKSNHAEQVTSDYYLKGKNIVIEGMTNITIKVGQSYIAIESGGIKIGTTGTIELEATSTLSMKGTAGVTVESPATLEVKGSMTTVKGDGILTLEGGLVKIN